MLDRTGAPPESFSKKSTEPQVETRPRAPETRTFHPTLLSSSHLFHRCLPGAQPVRGLPSNR